MSLRGPLHGQKQYLTIMLESYNITLQAIRFIESIGKKTTIYRFIYDTKRRYQQFIGSGVRPNLGILGHIKKNVNMTY